MAISLTNVYSPTGQSHYPLLTKDCTILKIWNAASHLTGWVLFVIKVWKISIIPSNQAHRLTAQISDSNEHIEKSIQGKTKPEASLVLFTKNILQKFWGRHSHQRVLELRVFGVQFLNKKEGWLIQLVLIYNRLDMYPKIAQKKSKIDKKKGDFSSKMANIDSKYDSFIHFTIKFNSKDYSI